MAPFFVLVGVASLLLVAGAAVPGWPLRSRWPAAIRFGLAAMFTVTGITHFAFLRADLIAMVPPGLPAPGLLVTVTGVLELLGAAGLLWRRSAAWAAAGLGLLLVAMFPANVYAALDGVELAGEPATPLLQRTVLQVVFLAATATVWLTHRRWALHVRDVPGLRGLVAARRVTTGARSSGLATLRAGKAGADHAGGKAGADHAGGKAGADHAGDKPGR